MNVRDAMDLVVDALKERHYNVYWRQNEYQVWSDGFNIATLQFNGGMIRVLDWEHEVAEDFYPEDHESAVRAVDVIQFRFFNEVEICDVCPGDA